MSKANSTIPLSGDSELVRRYRVPKKMKDIETNMIYQRHLHLLDSSMSLGTSDAGQPPFSYMICVSKKGWLFLCIYNLYTCTEN